MIIIESNQYLNVLEVKKKFSFYTCVALRELLFYLRIVPRCVYVVNPLAGLEA